MSVIFNLLIAVEIGVAIVLLGDNRCAARGGTASIGGISEGLDASEQRDKNPSF